MDVEWPKRRFRGCGGHWLRGARPSTGSLKRGPWPESTLKRLRQALEQISGELKHISRVDALVLFGSYARGDYRRKSDVDLLILMRPIWTRSSGRTR
jgi:UTP:GlnB (protein PII) uridylyltransferase